jgi:hypothetical protein
VLVTATCLVIPLAPQFWSVAVAGLIGALAAPFLGNPILFWTMGFTAVASVLAAAAVPARAIDHEVARGLLPGGLAARRCGA